METSLHRQLKEVYAGGDGEVEAKLGRYRIDVIRPQAAGNDLLIEVQHGGLAAIRDKVRALLKRHPVLVVKPIVARKRLVRRERPGGPVVSSRLSPKRGVPLDLFHELIHFTRAFPHPRLAIETPLVEVEEHRVPGHGRRRRWRKNDFVVEDQVLTRVQQTHRYETLGDLLTLLPPRLPTPFDTGQLAKRLEVDRWVAQRIAYCLRQTGAAAPVGKRGNAVLYGLKAKRPRRRRAG
ncbi:MAG: hypothetical protein AAF790_01185 [Planctomycetota bacterium]